MTDSPQVKTAENDVKAVVGAVGSAAGTEATNVAHDAERDTRSVIRKLLDEAEADASKGIAWFKAEVAKL